jgi:tetratricopeptide (TPR) repeat protein
MKQKIEWYREVLEIEPNSKIFFPLSRMLAKDGRPEEAIAILRQGVGRHPDHIEARLFLVELLYGANRAVELQQEVVVLSDMFKNYPGFWRAWGERLFDENESRDAGLAAIFLAAFLQNMPVSWAGVIEHGLKSLVSQETARPSATLAEAHPLASAPQATSYEESVSPAVAPFAAAPAKAEPVIDESALTDDGTDEDENEEPISLRTRSMADVLAEQGDIPGALDIYNELLAAAQAEEEKKALKHRIDVLSGNVAEVSTESVETGQSQDSQNEKKDWLAILAQRLEARSLQ